MRGYVQRAALFAAEGVGRGIVHGNDFVGVDDLDGNILLLVAQQFLADSGFYPDKKNAHPEFTCRSKRAFDLGSRGMVATHCINGYCNHLFAYT
jgi:hypothetical protein